MSARSSCRGAEGAKGIAEGQRDSSLLRFSVDRQQPHRERSKKGDIAITLGGDADELSAAGWSSAPSCAASTRAARSRATPICVPILDLDSLTFVKVLKSPVPIP